MRLNLAQALMCRSDLLLLDEPTNHLDLDAVIWLEAWLRDYRGTLLLISHDREFLDACVTHIAHIEQQKLALYTGGYSDFERQRGERLLQQQAMFDKQQRDIAHMEDYIRRFRAKATKARQAQSRIKALERMERIAAAHVDTPFSFAFRDAPPAPDPLLQIEDGAVGYGDKTVLERITLTLRPGERVGLLGRNGAGKSTLIKLLAHELQLASGRRLEGKGLATGYFAQHQLETLRPDESALQHMVRLDPQTREQELRDYLGGFDFRGDGVGGTSTPATTPCGPFSGGEKSRLALALADLAAPQPAAARRAHQPPRPRDAPRADDGAAGLRGRDGAGVARPRAAARHLRPLPAGRRRPHPALRRRPRRLPRLARQPPRRGRRGRGLSRPGRRQGRAQGRPRPGRRRPPGPAGRTPAAGEGARADRQAPGGVEQGEGRARRAGSPIRRCTPARRRARCRRSTSARPNSPERIEEAELRWLELHEALEAIPAD